MPTDPENGAGFVEGFDESEEFTEEDLVTITDEDGHEVECAIVAVITYDDAQYVMLHPAAQLEDEELEEIDTYIFLYEVNEEGLPTFSPIDSDEVFEAVCEAFSEM